MMLETCFGAFCASTSPKYNAEDCYLEHLLTNILWIISCVVFHEHYAQDKFLGHPVPNFQNRKITFFGLPVQDSFSVNTFMLSLLVSKIQSMLDVQTVRFSLYRVSQK